MNEASQHSGSGKLRTFGARFLSTVILLSILAGVCFWGNVWGYRLMLSAMCMLTSWEWGSMLRSSGRASQPWLSTVYGIVYPLVIVGSFAWMEWGSAELVTTADMLKEIQSLIIGAPVLLLIMSFIWEMRRPVVGNRPLHTVACTVLSFLYPVWMFSFAFLFTGTEPSCVLLLGLILLTKLSDIFAYVSGLLLGGRFVEKKLIPHISPKKTWEGLTGSYILTMAAIIWWGIMQWGEFSWLMLPYGTLFFLLAVTGDLSGSLVKRSLSIKDSGALLPGIGGFFDLIDSLAFTMSVVSVALIIIGA